MMNQDESSIMANGHGGKRKGAGRPKAAIAKKSVRRDLLLLEAKAQFEAYEYDPLQELIIIAQQEQITEQDLIHVEVHKLLARKYYPDVAAVKVSGDPDSPLSFMLTTVEYEVWLTAQGDTGVQETYVTNGHHLPSV